jgi:hypothetical protein
MVFLMAGTAPVISSSPSNKVTQYLEARGRREEKVSCIDTIQYYLNRLHVDSLHPSALEYPFRRSLTVGKELLEWLDRVRETDLGSMPLETLVVWANLISWPETVMKKKCLLRFCRRSSPPKLSCQELLACGRHPPDIGQVGGEFDPADPCHRYHAFFITIQLMDRDSLKNDKKLMNKINKDPFLHFVATKASLYDSLALPPKWRLPMAEAEQLIDTFLNLGEDTRCKVVLFYSLPYDKIQLYYALWYRCLIPMGRYSKPASQASQDSAWAVLTSPVADSFFRLCKSYADTSKYGPEGLDSKRFSRYPLILDSLREVRGR